MSEVPSLEAPIEVGGFLIDICSSCGSPFSYHPRQGIRWRSRGEIVCSVHCVIQKLKEGS